MVLRPGTAFVHCRCSSGCQGMTRPARPTSGTSHWKGAILPNQRRHPSSPNTGRAALTSIHHPLVLLSVSASY